MAGLPIRVLVVDDFHPWHKFYSRELQKQANLQIIGYVSDGLKAVQEAQELQPDLILMDVGLPTLNGIEATRRIGEVCPTCKILFVSTHPDADIVLAAINNGAGGYLLKTDASFELWPAIKAVLEGELFISPRLAVDIPVPPKAGASQSGPPTDSNAYLRLSKSPHISEFLEAIIKTTGVDFAFVKLYDSTNHVLRIVAQHGFRSEFVERFNAMGDVHSACNESMNERSRIVVTDVAIDPVFADDLKDLLLQSQVRSLQSTPLIDSSGNFVGVVSTHCRRPGIPSLDVLMQIDNLATGFLAKITDGASM